MTSCPHCTDRATLIKIRGETQTLVDAFEVFDQESDVEPVLYVAVEVKHRNGTAPPKEPLTEPVAEQP